MKRITYSLLFFLLAFIQLSFGQTVTMPNIIGSNMVLQQNTQVPLWGWAASGTQVDITPSWGTKITVTADATGNWKTTIQTPIAVAGQAPTYTVTVAGPQNTLAFTNILIGEVWLCSGQSNMAFVLNYESAIMLGVVNYQSEIAAANYPNIRLFTVPNASATTPQTNCGGSWATCTPTTAASFSAVAYYFGRELYLNSALNVPIGIINDSYSGSCIQTWMKKETLTADAELKAKYVDPVTTTVTSIPSGIYNAKIAPIIPFAIKGVIWYQGESNASDGAIYTKANISMINDWRADWGTDFSFYAVQLTPRLWSVGQLDTGYGRTEFRERQSEIQSLPKTGIIPTCDVMLNTQELTNAHPRDKKTVGQRLAHLALAKDYGQAIPYLGPLYDSFTVEGNKIRITFKPETLGTGLTKGKGNNLTEFRISASDKNFYLANAVIEGNTVLVSSPSVATPVAVRFGFTDAAMTNLMSKEGLAAYPFKTDNWSSGITNISPTSPAPLTITFNDGIKNIASDFYASAGCTVSYIQDPNNVALDTVMQFVRNTNIANSFAGPIWSGASVDNFKGVDVGPATPSQFKYLVVRAKQSTITPFFIKLQQVAGNLNYTSNDIQSVTTAVANQWVDYVFDVSVGTNIPNTFLAFMLMPEKGLASTTTLINKIYFTNNISVSGFHGTVANTPSFARSATAIDLYWTAIAEATSYNIIDNNGANVKTGITTNSASVTGLLPNTSYTFKIIAINSAGEESQPSVAVTAITRKQKGTNFELVEDFEGQSNAYWAISNSAAGSATIPSANLATTGINTSSYCAKVNILLNGSQRRYTALNAPKERLDVGPNVAYRYLHVKMYRNQDIGGFGAYLMARTDIMQVQLAVPVIPFNEKMTDGTWDDYVFDLKTLSTTNQTFYGFYLTLNYTSGNPTMATTTYIDDVYLSNDLTPITSNLNTLNISLSANNNSYGAVSGAGACLQGSPTTVTAVPANGYRFVKWTNGTADVSNDAVYTFSPTADIALSAVFESTTGINELVAANLIRVNGRNVEIQTNEVEVEIYNTVGSLVASHQDRNTTISLQNAGIYIVRLKTNQGLRSQKIEIQ